MFDVLDLLAKVFPQVKSQLFVVEFGQNLGKLWQLLLRITNGFGVFFNVWEWSGDLCSDLAHFN